MNKTFAEQLKPVAAAIIGEVNAESVSRFVYYDVADDVDDLLTNGELKSRVFASMAWLLDMNCINIARGLFYDLYKETTEVNTIDAFNAFMMNVRDMAHTGEHAHDIGFENTSNWDTLVDLLNLRGYWHDYASKFATRRYEPKSLTALMADEKQQAVTSIDRQKLGMLAEFAGDGDSDVTKQMLERLEVAQNGRFKDAYENRRRLIPAVSAILQRASNSAAIRSSDDQVPDFHKLPVNIQLRLIGGARGAVDRALTDMGTMRSITVMEFATYLKEGGALMKRLNTVMKAPKFADL